MSAVHRSVLAFLLLTAFLLIAARPGFAAHPLPPTPERPPILAVLASVENDLLTFVFWRHELQIRTMTRQVTENGETKTIAYQSPELVHVPRQVALRSADVVGSTVSGQTIDGSNAWQALIGRSLLLLAPEMPLDPVYQAALAPETVIVQPRSVVPQPTPAPYPDGTLPPGTGTGSPSQPPPGSPTPAQLASAQNAIQPELVKLKIKIAPAPLMNPLLQAALPGFMFFPVDGGDDAGPAGGGRRRPRILIVKKPDGSSTTLSHDDESVFDLLRDQFTVLTDADARKYVRTHLLLVEARHPQFTYGPIDKITVTPTDKGGRTAEGEAPITGGGNEEKRPAAFTLHVTFNKAGKLIGGKRAARAE